MSEKQTIRLAELKDLNSIVEIYNLSIPGRLATADTEQVTVESRFELFHSHNEKRPLYVVEETVGSTGSVTKTNSTNQTNLTNTTNIIAFLSFKSFARIPFSGFFRKQTRSSRFFCAISQFRSNNIN